MTAIEGKTLYLCTGAIKQGHATCPVRPVAASEAELLVLAQMQAVFRAPEIVVQVITPTAKPGDTAADGRVAARDREIVEALGSLETVGAELFPAE